MQARRLSLSGSSVKYLAWLFCYAAVKNIDADNDKIINNSGNDEVMSVAILMVETKHMVLARSAVIRLAPPKSCRR